MEESDLEVMITFKKKKPQRFDFQTSFYHVKKSVISVFKQNHNTIITPIVNGILSVTLVLVAQAACF